MGVKPIPVSPEEYEFFASLLNTHTIGAYPAGTRVRKMNSVDTDGHKNGDFATVLSSTQEIRINGMDIRMYNVVWDDMPTISTLVASNRLEPVPV